jgi:hypothetical protein
MEGGNEGPPHEDLQQIRTACNVTIHYRWRREEMLQDGVGSINAGMIVNGVHSLMAVVQMY